MISEEMIKISKKQSDVYDSLRGIVLTPYDRHIGIFLSVLNEDVNRIIFNKIKTEQWLPWARFSVQINYKKNQ